MICSCAPLDPRQTSLQAALAVPSHTPRNAGPFSYLFLFLHLKIKHTKSVSLMATLQVSKAPPDLCRRKPKCLLQNNTRISQASNPSQWALPLLSHLTWCVRPTTARNHLVYVEKRKAEWFTLRSNAGGHQDSRFISRKSLTLCCHWTPAPAPHVSGASRQQPCNRTEASSLWQLFPLCSFRLAKFLFCYLWL